MTHRRFNHHRELEETSLDRRGRGPPKNAKSGSQKISGPTTWVNGIADAFSYQGGIFISLVFFIVTTDNIYYHSNRNLWSHTRIKYTTYRIPLTCIYTRSFPPLLCLLSLQSTLTGIYTRSFPSLLSSSLYLSLFRALYGRSPRKENMSKKAKKSSSSSSDRNCGTEEDNEVIKKKELDFLSHRSTSSRFGGGGGISTSSSKTLSLWSYKRTCDHKACIICREQITTEDEGELLLIYICNFHVISHLLLIYICKLHWNSGCVVTVPSKRLTKLAQKTLNGLHMKWDKKNVVDYLHSKCWDSVSSNWRLRKEYSKTEQLIFQDIEDTVEKLCCEKDLVRQVKEVVQLMLHSKHTVCFTGVCVCFLLISYVNIIKMI